jgi:putative ABC transport system substrate-binding protein
MMILDPGKHQLNAPNMTGTSLEVPVERQLRLLRQFLPWAHRLGTLYDPKKSAGKLKEASQAAALSQFEIQDYAVESEKDVPQQLRALLASNEALWLMPDSTVLTNDSIRYILESALEKHIPVIGFSPEFTRLGALLSISVNYTEVGRETGLLAKRLLEGDHVPMSRAIPIERLKISVNLKTAKFLGLTIPPGLMSLIDESY